LRKLENRCKFCAKRQALFCPIVRAFVGPEVERYDCESFKQRDLGMPLEQKKRGGLGRGCNCGK